MARGGFLSGIAKSLGKIADRFLDFFGEPEEEPPRPPSPPPAPPKPPPSPPNPLIRIWKRVTKGRDRDDMDAFREWHNLYDSGVDALDLDRDEYEEFWGDFLKAYYLTTGERGHIKRQTFHRRIGIRQRDWEMDWEEWRAMKRGTP